jgi:hypothetical protein
MLLNHEKYQSSFDKAMACAVECEHCAEACMGQPEMVKCVRMCLDTQQFQIQNRNKGYIISTMKLA